MTEPEGRYAADRGPWMRTYTGRLFYPLDPCADEVSIEDVAHALSQICRYAGHTSRFYSVAEHSVKIAAWLGKTYPDRPELALWGLLHDASEAYVVDVPRPVKVALPQYKAIESRVLAACLEAFGLVMPMPEEVHQVDVAIVGDEMRQLLPGCSNWDGCLGATIEGWAPDEAEASFLRWFHAFRARRSAAALRSAFEPGPAPTGPGPEAAGPLASGLSATSSADDASTTSPAGHGCPAEEES